MGILDDFGDIFKEIADIRQDISEQVSGLRKDVTDSMTDIDQGIKRKKDAVKRQIAQPLSLSNNTNKPNKPIDDKPNTSHLKIEVK